MPFALIIAGTVLLISSAKNTLSNQQGTGLYQLIASDFTGSNNFIFWALSILVIGAVGYVPKLKPFSVAFMTLVIIVLVLLRGNPQSGAGGFFSKFLQAISTTQSATPSVAVSSLSGSSTGAIQTATSNSGGSLLGLINSSPFGSVGFDAGASVAPPVSTAPGLSPSSTPVVSSPVTSTGGSDTNYFPAPDFGGLGL